MIENHLITDDLPIGQAFIVNNNKNSNSEKSDSSKKEATKIRTTENSAIRDSLQLTLDSESEEQVQVRDPDLENDKLNGKNGTEVSSEIEREASSCTNSVGFCYKIMTTACLIVILSFYLS